MKDIDLIDYLLKVSKGNSVIVRTVEIYVPLECFEEGHVTADIFEYLTIQKKRFYVHDGALYINRKDH